MIKITIDGQTVKVPKGITVLEACKEAGIYIPTLCYLKELNEIGFCRVCVVDVEKSKDLVAACNTPVQKGMVIKTNTKQVKDSRRSTLELLASKHRFNCWACPADGHCEFYDVLKIHNIQEADYAPAVPRRDELIVSKHMSFDFSKCIVCKRCISKCNDINKKVLSYNDDDPLNPFVAPKNMMFNDTLCADCGECIDVCPTGTLFATEKEGDL